MVNGSLSRYKTGDQKIRQLDRKEKRNRQRDGLKQIKRAAVTRPVNTQWFSQGGNYTQNVFCLFRSPLAATKQLKF